MNNTCTSKGTSVFCLTMRLDGNSKPYRQCKVEGCAKEVMARDFCSMHYTRLIRHGSPHIKSRKREISRVACTVKGCDKEARFKKMCTLHYQRKRAGYPLITEKEKFIMDNPPKNGVGLIPLTRGEFAIVDEENYKELVKYSWCLRKNRNKWLYAIRAGKNGENKTVFMHNQIMRTPNGKLVDHINRNGIDNRKSNLRFCTNSQNCMNTRPTGKSKYKCVYLDTRYNKWTVKVLNKYCGIFDNEIEAAFHADKMMQKYHGEFAYLNFPKRRDFIQKDREAKL